MTRQIPRISAMERDITTKHWLPNDSEHSYTWHNLNVEVVAAHYHTTQKTVRETMKRIERKHPAPNPDKNAELAKKAPTGDTCKKCGAPIVWVGHRACDPPILEFVSVGKQVYTGREVHHRTCTHAQHGKEIVNATTDVRQAAAGS